MERPITIPQIHAAYAAGLDPRKLLDDTCAAIDCIDDPGIFISRMSLKLAKAAVDALGPFDPVRKPLWGIPFAVKDNIDVAGLPTTAACPAFTYEPVRSAHAVERLVDAGAIVIGKTNLDQFATGLVGVRTPYPVPRNALDPTLIPGGSSSGSAVAVAHGLVPFALGTDTAGSGRVPAGLNNIVGLKPSLGAISTRGVLPACRTLDCVSVFALTTEDAFNVARIANGFDPEDPFSRPCDMELSGLPPRPRIGVPNDVSREFFGDDQAAAAFDKAIAYAEAGGAALQPCDLSTFRETAELLYGGPWVAERYQAIRAFIEQYEVSLHPVVGSIIMSATGMSAADTFAGIYRLAELRRRTAPMWDSIDVLMVPTVPTVYTVEEVLSDPVTLNSRLGTYTNFVNLLDLCALAVPSGFRADGRPAGVTLISQRGRDGLLAALGARLHEAAGVPLGATQQALESRPPKPASAPPGWIEVVCVGAHMSGLPLNVELTRLGGIFVRSCRTEPNYRLYALAGFEPARPGLLRVRGNEGAAIETEVWALPAAAFGAFASGIAAPLGLASVRLADGTRPMGFVVESAGLINAIDISQFGGWRTYLMADQL